MMLVSQHRGRVDPPRDVGRRSPIPQGGAVNPRPLPELSRRERQIMDIVYREGRATVAEVQAALPQAPGYSAVRAMLRVLEEKGHLRHRQDGPRYVYEPTLPRDRARRSALRRMLRTFFDDSPGDAVAALLDLSQKDLTDEELARLSALIQEARGKGR
jgi:predicted transcriptional regulator